MTNYPKSRVALYIRVSSEEQAENGDSIRDQRERCRKYIEDHGNMVLHDTYIDGSDKIGLKQQTLTAKRLSDLFLSL